MQNEVRDIASLAVKVLIKKLPYIFADRSRHCVGHTISFELKKFNVELTRT